MPCGHAHRVHESDGHHRREVAQIDHHPADGDVDDRFIVEIEDDGRGVNWERVKEKAASLGMPTDTQEQLSMVLFSGVRIGGGMMTQVFCELEQMLSEATVELWDSYGLSVAPTGSAEPVSRIKPRVVATIGFVTEDGTRGNIVLVSSPELVTSVQPPELDMHSDAAVCDILGELSNMLLGRLKNALLPRGVILLLGTPTTTLALKLWDAAPFTPSSWLAFDVGGQEFHVRLAASLSDSFEFLDEVPAAAPALAEGDMILF